MEMNEEKKKMQNLISLCILFAGLLVGSLFVDVAQLLSGSGFSRHIVEENNVLETGGKTWVSYTDPRVDLIVLTDSSCSECDPNQALTWIRRIIPTTVARTVEYSSEEGQRLILDQQITSLPAFLFSEDIKRTGFYGQADGLFSEAGNRYVFDMKKIGQAPGKFLSLPEVQSDDISIGSADAKITLVEYSDFQCPYSKLFQSALQKVIKEYPNDIRLVYKHLPLSFHPQAENAALAAECAHENGKFATYSDVLFAKQDEWSKTSGTLRFKDYARTIGIDTRKFNACLDTKKYAEKVKSDSEEAASFGIAGTPGTFLDNEFINGAISYDELKAKIDTLLAK